MARKIIRNRADSMLSLCVPIRQLNTTKHVYSVSSIIPYVRWGTFPSLAWNVKEESFLKDTKLVLKVRGGYGVTGQQDLPTSLSDYPYLARYTISDTTAEYPFGATFNRTLRAEGYDVNIKWEQTQAVNIGQGYTGTAR